MNAECYGFKEYGGEMGVSNPGFLCVCVCECVCVCV